MFLVIKLISGELTAGDPLSEEGQTLDVHLGKNGITENRSQKHSD